MLNMNMVRLGVGEPLQNDFLCKSVIVCTPEADSLPPCVVGGAGYM